MTIRNMMRRLGVLAAAAAMALGLATPALADMASKTATVTIGGLETGEGVASGTATAYKIIDVNWDDANGQPKTPNYTWNNAVKDTVAGIPDTDYVGADGSVADSFTGADAAKKVADAIAGAGVGTAIEGTVANGTATFSNLEMGGYLVVIANSTNRVYQPIVVNVVPQYKDGAWVLDDASLTNITAKYSETGITKKITGVDNETTNVAEDGKTAGAGIGDTVSYQLESPVPAYPDNAKSTVFKISDALTNLDLVADSIKVVGVPARGAEVELKDGFTKTATANGFTLDFTYANIKQYQKIKVTYNAKVNASAKVTEANPNTATLTYSNAPYTENNFTTKTDDAKVYTYGLNVLKVDADNHETKLSGAEFELYQGKTKIDVKKGDDGVYRPDANGADVLTTSDPEGAFKLDGLAPGSYSLKETKAPGGYSLPSGTIDFTIADDDLDGKVNEGTTGYVSQTVQNSKGFQLPTTGGAGTVALTAAGVLVMAGAAFALIRARRSE